MVIEKLESDHLAQYVGCYPENPCYHDCCESAQSMIDDNTDPELLEEALNWARQENWT